MSGAATDIQPAGATPDQQVATATATAANLRLLPLPGQIPRAADPAGGAALPAALVAPLRTVSPRCRRSRSRRRPAASRSAAARRSPARAA